MQRDEQNRIFAEWLEGYQSLLFKIVSVYAFTPADRDDLFQEVAVQLWRSIPSFRQECAPKSWIYRVALNYAIAWTKREAKYQKGKHPFDERVHVLSEIDDGSGDRLRWLYARIGDLLRAWKAENEQPRYVINHDELESILQERSIRLREVLYSDEIKNYWTGLWIVGFLASWFWIGPGESRSSTAYSLSLTVAVAAVLYYVAYSFLSVAQRRSRAPETIFSFSLREQLASEIEYLRHQIAARTHWKHVLMHLVPPWLACMIVVWASGIRSDGVFQWHDILGLVVVTGGWVHMHILERKWVSRELAPRKQELKELYQRLVEPEAD